MPILNQFLEIQTEPGISICNVTPHIEQLLETASIRQGQVLLFSRHTTTALDTTTGIATGTFVFVGGTGRFDQAQGRADFTVTQDLNSGTFEVVAQGRIDY